ncbi:MAG: sulfurtransferase TusA family protein [Pseudomonadota bacterium]
MDVVEIDARGLLCPLPVLKARKAMQSLVSGARLKLLADDPAAIIDVPHFCQEAGHRLISQSEVSDHQIYELEKG